MLRGPPSGEPVAAVVARGEAGVGFQQVAELIHGLLPYDCFFNSTVVTGNHRYVHHVCYISSKPSSILHTPAERSASSPGVSPAVPRLAISMGALTYMAAAGPVIQGAVCDPAATHVMGEAFDCACRALHDIAQVDNAVKESETRFSASERSAR